MRASGPFVASLYSYVLMFLCWQKLTDRKEKNIVKYEGSSLET